MDKPGIFFSFFVVCTCNQKGNNNNNNKRFNKPMSNVSSFTA